LDRHLLIETFRKIEQLIHGELAEMPVHEVGNFSSSAGSSSAGSAFVFGLSLDIRFPTQRAQDKAGGTYDARTPTGQDA
jgi:hypothetical protein